MHNSFLLPVFTTLAFVVPSLAIPKLPVPTCAVGVGKCYRALAATPDDSLEFCKSFTATSVHTSYIPTATKCYGWEPRKPRQLNRRISSVCSCLEAQATPTPDPTGVDNGSGTTDPSTDDDTNANEGDTDGTTPSGTTLDTATATLLPAVPTETDLSDYDNLKPVDSAMLYYAEQSGVQNPYLKTQFVKLDANFKYPTVVLEYSQYVDSVTCDDDGLDVEFNNEQAFQVVKQAWANIPKLVIVTFTNGCGASSDLTRTLWLASDITFETDGTSKWAEVTAQEILTQSGLTDANVEWGTYIPDDQAPADVDTGVLTCAAPPSNPTDGLPSAACGDDFDQNLDDQIGYLPFDQESFSSSLEKFAPGLGVYILAYYQSYSADAQRRRMLARLRRRHQLARRGFGDFLDDVGDFFGDVGDAIGDTAGDIYDGVTDCIGDIGQCADDVGDAIGDGIDAIGNAISDFLTAGGDIGSATLSVDMSLEGEEETPWGDGYELFKYPSDDEEKEEDGKGGSEKKLRVRHSTNTTDIAPLSRREGGLEGSLAVYCVDCGVTGSVTIYGHAVFSVAELKVTSLGVGLNGGLHAEVNLGLVGKVSYEKKFSKILTSHGIDGFLAVPDVIIVGPVLTLSTELDLEVELEGSLLVGAALDIGPFNAYMDFVDDSKNTATGFDASVTKRFEASASLTAKAGVYLPIDIGIGISIPPINFKETISLVDKPGFELEAKVSVSYDGSDEQEGGDEEEEDDECDNGISWSLSVANTIDFVVPGFDPTTLFERSYPLLGECYPFNSDPAEATASDTSTQVSLIDSTSAFYVSASSGGNLFMSSTPPSSALTAFSNLLLGDGKSRFFHYHTDLMEKYGVSRLRLADKDHLPTTGDMFLLEPVPVNGATVYLAINTLNSLFYPVTCRIVNGATTSYKMFLVKDPVAGLTMLKQADLQWTVTGGVVQQCLYLPMIALST